MSDTDIVTSLRSHAKDTRDSWNDLPIGLDTSYHDRDMGRAAMCDKAADEIERQTEIIVTLRQQLKEAKARNTLLLSKIQEYEAREQ